MCVTVFRSKPENALLAIIGVPVDVSSHVIDPTLHGDRGQRGGMKKRRSDERTG